MTEPNTKPYASSFVPVAFAIYKVGEETKPHANITPLVTHFYHMEDIFSPSYEAKMVMSDNALSLMSSMPIQGNEKVVVEVEDAFKNRYQYHYRVWTVFNRIAEERTQAYTLGLISDEGLNNEGVRLSMTQSGLISDVVSKLLKEKLKVSESKIDCEKTKTGCRVIPRKQSVFSVIKSLQMKAVSDKDYTEFRSILKDPSGETPETTNDSEVGADAKLTKDGSAGYVFFQTNRGFNFRSFDGLASTEPVNKDERNWFKVTPAKRDDVNPNKIQEVKYIQEINMMRKLREGAYSSLSAYFNLNTGKYEEYVYSLDNVWHDMVHLGSQTSLPKGQTDLSKSPTRIMSSVVNNEFWFDGPDPAEDDGGVDVKDYQKFYLQQSIGRSGIMFNQQLAISLTGHLELCAGDCVEIRIPSQKAEVLRTDEAWDPEHSGTYLVKGVTHQFFVTGGKVYTVLELIRDSYGIKASTSKTV